MRFPAKKNAGCPKAPRDSPPRKDRILYPRRVVLGLPSLSHRVCADGRTYGCTDVRTYGHVTLTSQPKCENHKDNAVFPFCSRFVTTLHRKSCLNVQLMSYIGAKSAGKCVLRHIKRKCDTSRYFCFCAFFKTFSLARIPPQGYLIKATESDSSKI